MPCESRGRQMRVIALSAVLCALLTGCATKIEVTSISPAICTRHTARVSEQIGAGTVTSARRTPFDVSTRREVFVYGGMPEDNKISIKGSGYERIIDLENPSMSWIPFGTRYWDIYNFRGKDGELYYWTTAFYIVIFSATPDQLEYEIHRHYCDNMSCNHVPCGPTVK